MTEQFAIQLFENRQVRVGWNAEEEEWYFSVVDVCRVLADSQSKDAGAYWRKLKQRLKAEGSEVVTKCHELKMPSADGKKYKTDCLSTPNILRLIQSIPSPKAEPFKVWLAEVGARRIDQMIDPELTFQQAVEDYRRRGYSDRWIEERMKSIRMRKALTDEWERSGIHAKKDFAILTNILTKAWSGMTTGEYKQYKGLTKENLRDNMTDIELVLNTLAEVATTEISKHRNPQGMSESRGAAQDGGRIAKNARNNLERELGRSVISSKKATDYLPTKEGGE
jgi:hypothetical protein